MDDNCIYTEYDNIKDYENNNLFIENYNGQLNLLGYFTIKNHNDFISNYNLNINFNFENINNIPSIFVEYTGEDIDLEDKLFKLKTLWDKNCYKIFNCLLTAVNINDNLCIKYINNNYLKISKEYNKSYYYENILNILDL